MGATYFFHLVTPKLEGGKPQNKTEERSQAASGDKQRSTTIDGGRTDGHITGDSQVCSRNQLGLFPGEFPRPCVARFQSPSKTSRHWRDGPALGQPRGKGRREVGGSTSLTVSRQFSPTFFRIQGGGDEGQRQAAPALSSSKEAHSLGASFKHFPPSKSKTALRVSGEGGGSESKTCFITHPEIGP